MRQKTSRSLGARFIPASDGSPPKGMVGMKSDSSGQSRQASAAILLVDDHAPNLVALETILQPLGHRLIRASAGMEAVELMRHQEVAVVLMDVRMPGLDGFETAGLMHSELRAKDIPVVFLIAADTDRDTIRHALAHGAADFLLRPFEDEILRSKVAFFFDLYLKERKNREQASAMREQERQALERSSNLRFGELMDAMPLCVIVTDRQRRPVYWNESSLSYIGAVPEGANSAHALLDAVHPQDRDELMRRWDTATTERHRFELKFRIRGRDGLFRSHLGRGIPQRDDQGAVIGWILTATDIEAENQALLRAETANRVKDEFLATVSHELRNPLNAIVGWVHLLRVGNLDADQSRHALQTIERNVHLQVSLIDEILDLSRIARGKIQLSYRLVDLVSLINSALDVIRPAAEAKELCVEWNWEGPSLRIMGDPERLQQVISNLLSNAVKFTPPGGVIRVGLERSYRHAVMTVQDTGKGIRPEFLPFIFETFRQADNTTTRQDYGLGLGLSIARKLVELHGGHIMAESEGVDRGATFSVTLPIDPLTGKTEQKAEAPLSGEHALEGVRVLIIEDHSDSRDAVAELLKGLGAVPLTADSVHQAIKLMTERESPDVVISDLAMPGEDGFALIRWLHAHPPRRAGRILTIALTGLSDPKHSKRALEEGFDTCMVKPLEVGRLVEYISTSIAHSGERTIRES